MNLTWWAGHAAPAICSRKRVTTVTLITGPGVDNLLPFPSQGCKRDEPIVVGRLQGRDARPLGPARAGIGARTRLGMA